MTGPKAAPGADSRKKFDTLDAEHVALIYRAAELVDARDAGDCAAASKLEAVRARRDAVKAELRRRDPAFDRWEC
jgi:hypothetical protein